MREPRIVESEVVHCQICGSQLATSYQGNSVYLGRCRVCQREEVLILQEPQYITKIGIGWADSESGAKWKPTN